MDTKTITRTRRVLVGGRWFLIIGFVFYSLMTTTPFVSAHSEWAWSGWVLGLIVDAAFIMALSAESTLAKYGVTKLGKWPIAFRWVTGLSSVFLNVWLSVEARDWVGVAVHLIAPALVMLLAEVGPVYMKALADAERDAGLPYTGTPKFTPLSIPEPLTTVDYEEIKAKWLREYGKARHDSATPLEDLGTPETEPQRLHTLTGSNPISARFLKEPEPKPDPIDVAQDFASDAPQDEPTRMPNAEANKIIEEGWRHKLSAVEVAAATGRHPATIRKKYKQLDAELTV
ncbi:peptidase C14 [Streptomyces finlayi]|uniref:Peptidase C14 n=1 Tax=Streptomyces finlayi TaxID=67296 RepID=A0A7G7BFB1_9ACTN|nr:peptidase C14 [Streptomyces finlayi]QNE74026.1 peptidase C14 [Streptomyces finlayi]